VTVHPVPGAGFVILAVRVTPKNANDGSVYVAFPANGTDTAPGPFILAAGVLDVPGTYTADGITRITTEDRAAFVGGAMVALAFGANDYAAIPEDAPLTGNGFGVWADASEIVAAAGRVAGVADSTRNNRPVLTGVLLDYTRAPHRLTVAATDSYRLHTDTVTCGGVTVGSVITPAAAFARVSREAARGGKRAPAHVRISHEIEGWTTYAAGDTFITARDVDGQYPDYARLVPEVFDHRVNVDRDGIAAAIESVTARMRVATGSKGSAPMILSTIAQNVGQVAMTAPNDGPTFTDTFRMSGENVAPMGLNSGFLADVVKAMPGDSFVLSVASPLRPVYAVACGVSEATALLMPIRLPA
jgi:DNA polymerase-3 subunit beta